MATPEPPSWLPPQWLIDNYHEKNPGAPRRSRLDPVMIALWHQVIFGPPQPLCLVTGI